ncbi:unnamed protein product [Gadus morhua 'NCC']
MLTAHAPWVLLNAPDIDPAAKAGRNQDGERRSDRMASEESGTLSSTPLAVSTAHPAVSPAQPAVSPALARRGWCRHLVAVRIHCSSTSGLVAPLRSELRSLPGLTCERPSVRPTWE